MAGTLNVSVMALLGLLIMAALDFTVAQLGVCYGTNGNNLPPASEVVALYRQNNISRMRIFDPNQATLRALAGSNIELTIGIANEDLPRLAASAANAVAWVQNNIKNHPNVRFKYIAVGNEISPLHPNSSFLVGSVVPAMQNIFNALSSAGLANQIKVSTVVETGLLGNSYPPSAGAFRADVASFINPVVGFLARNGLPLLVNVYPYFAYIGNKAQIDLKYALFTSETGVVAGGVRYQNLFYAILDAVYAALERSGGPSVEVVVAETGWPSAGGDSANLENARIYNTNLVQKLRSGTPKRPGRPIETYVFAMFDENTKNPEYEKHWGIFYPNKQRKYPMTF